MGGDCGRYFASGSGTSFLGSYQHGIKVGGGTSSDFLSAALPAVDLKKYTVILRQKHMVQIFLIMVLRCMFF